MCGIAGIFSYGGAGLPIEQAELLDMREALAARGPDGSGTWIEKGQRVGLAHRRLAIIDLSQAAAQPMQSDDGRLVVIFNGEIYNYRQLKAELEADGHSFRTTSDTEVLLALYRVHREAMVEKLRGMYAFAMWDASTRELLLARDPFGIKPLYYADRAGTIRFASQVKALVRGDGIRLTPDAAGHTGFFVFGYVPEPHTLYKEICALPAGSVLRVRQGEKPAIKQFYDLRSRVASAQTAPRRMSAGERLELISDALRDSVRHHLVSDVPVGVFLSSGIDSSVIAATSQSTASSKLSAVTMGFHEFQGTSLDEVPLARLQARHLGLDHLVRSVSRDEFYEDLHKIWSSMDQPTTDGINTWLVSKKAAEAGLKVCLSGLGGDELFGGYPSFRQIPKLIDALSKLPSAALFDWILKHSLALVPERVLSPKYAQTIGMGRSLPGAYLLRRALFLPPELRAFLDPDLVREGLAELREQESLSRSVSGIASQHASISVLELQWYMRSQLLRDTDWAGMAHGLEIRTPLVDVRLVEAILPALISEVPPSKQDLASVTPGKLLDDITQRPKTGFATPVRQWLTERYQETGRYRGLRAWSRIVYSEFVPELSLLPDDPIPPRLSGSGPVLVYRIGQLGDTLVSLPALDAIRKQHPDKRLVLVTDRHPERTTYVSAWDVVGPTELCNGVLYYSVFEQTLKNLSIYLRLMRKIRSVAPSAVINLAPRVRDKDARRDRFFFRMLCGVPTYQSLAPAKTSRAPSGSSRVEPEWLRLLRVVDSNAMNSEYSLQIPRWARHEAESALAELPDNITNIIAITPGSKMPAKRWPAERFRHVGEELLQRNCALGLAVLGGPEDQALGDELCNAWGARSINLAGRLSVYGSAAVLKRCQLYVGNDSGAMHLAGFAGVRCVALFSARDMPGKWNPFGKGHQVLRQPIECEGCMLEICDRKNLCLTKIEVSSVLDHIAVMTPATLASNV